MANNIGKKQIATYKNKVVEIVPEYNQYGASKETITITKTSVIQGIYAPYSNNEQTEGMYILAHTINDGHYSDGNWGEYKTHQLVARDDLNYRFLLPTGEDSTSPTYNALLASCVHSSNTDRTISRDEGHNIYETTLTPEDGYSKVPAGRVEKQKGNGTWESVYSWNTPLDSVAIRILDVDGNLRFVFNSNCIYELTVYTTIDGVPQPNPLVIEGICETPINVDDYAQSISGKTFINITKDGTPISGEQDFCENTSIYVNYTTNEYTVTNRIDPDCATVEISNPTPEYGDTVDITITKTSDKANIGEGSISMEGADNPIYSWDKIVGPISYHIDSVIGSITIDAKCGDPANHPVRLEWYNDEEPESNPVITSINISHGSTIHPKDSDCTSTFTLPTGYEIKYSVPDMDRSITITDNNTIIQYHYGLKKYKVTYIGDSTVTINTSESDEVKHGEEITTRNVYTIESGYQNATATIVSGTATGASTDNGSVTVTGVTSNVTVRISADSIPTHNYCVRFSIEQAGTIGGDEPYCSTIQEGTCHEDISYSLNSGYEIYGEIPSQITINADNTIDVCNITEDVDLVIPVRLVTHTVKYCLTDGLGISLIGAQGQCITKNVVHGLNSTQGFSLTSGYNSVIVDSITPQDKPYNIDYDNNTININNITENVEIWMHAGAIPDQNVTFKLFIDGVEKPEHETTRSVAYGSTANNAFRSLGIVIDRTDVTVTADVAGVTTSYRILSDAAIGVSGTPITEATVITTYLKSVQQKTVTNIYASGMDAMGGVIFQAKFDDGTYDSDQSKFSVSYPDNNGNTSTSKDVVNVFDYSLDKGSLDAEGSKYVSGAKGIYQKSKLDLDYPTGSGRTKQVTVTYLGYSKPLPINQRAEVYGYYTNGNDVFDASSSSEDLTSATWKSNELIVDYGDSSNMYGSSDLDSSLKGLDGYNKDITPYYITGTYIGENPLDHLTDNEGGTITGNNKPYGLSTYNGSENTQYKEHYHITWNEAGLNKAFRKGYIFSYDGLEVETGFCGGLPNETSTTGECVGTGLKNTTHTLEAISKESDHKITTDSKWTYTAYYYIPSHNYGKDAISYYHIDNSEYRWNINSENNPFKDVNENTLTFSYPLHISSNYNLEEGVTITGTGNISAWGAGPTSYALSTVRLRISGSDPSNYVPDDNGYTLYEQSVHPAYYDYNNKLYLDNNTDTVIFDPYNNNLYEENSEAYRALVDVGHTGAYTDMGRRVDIYYSLMSPETLIRPKTENGVTKFGVLSGVYNGVDYSEYEDKMYSVGVSDYILNNGLFGRTRYISQHSWNVDENESREPTNDISIENYPYTISGTNENYNRLYDSEHDVYETLTTRPSENTILEHCWYNLINNITFDQYYNTQERKNNYFHTSSQAKYVDCSISFDTAEYERYDINNSSKTWEEVVLEGIISIVKNPEESTDSHTVYTITTNENVYPNCVPSSWYNQGTYYHRDTENVGTYYTNAEYIELYSFKNHLDCNACGVGSVSWTIKDDTGVTIHTDTLNDSGYNAILSYQNSDGKPLTIEVRVNTNTKEYNKGNTDPYVEDDEENNVFTGGTLLSMHATWNDGDERHIDVGVQGSSKYDYDTGNPGESGPTILTWKNLNDYFAEGYNADTFTNSGNRLYHKVRPTDN